MRLSHSSRNTKNFPSSGKKNLKKVSKISSTLVKSQATRNQQLKEKKKKTMKATFGCQAKSLLASLSRKPTLEKFDEKITFLTAVKNSIADMKTPTDIGWLRVNSQPLKNALENIVNSWINKYTNFLLSNTVSEIKNIETFINEVTTGIKEVP